jgi:hypothetical protein
MIIETNMADGITAPLELRVQNFLMIIIEIGKLHYLQGQLETTHEIEIAKPWKRQALLFPMTRLSLQI